MKPSTPPQPRKRPKQARSLMLVKAIQEACLRILEQEGPDQLTTQRIADVAGINIASLYQYFPNKEAVLADLFEEQIRQYTASGRERIMHINRLAQTDFAGTLRAIVDMEVDQHLMLQQMDPDFYQGYQNSFDVHQRINELTISLNNPSWEEWFPRFLSQHRDKLRGQDIHTQARMARHVLSGTLLSAVKDEPGLLMEGELKQELFTLLFCYLCK
jgi:AcrR family transcriptional regulator